MVWLASTAWILHELPIRMLSPWRMWELMGDTTPPQHNNMKSIRVYSGVLSHDRESIKEMMFSRINWEIAHMNSKQLGQHPQDLFQLKWDKIIACMREGVCDNTPLTEEFLEFGSFLEIISQFSLIMLTLVCFPYTRVGHTPNSGWVIKKELDV